MNEEKLKANYNKERQELEKQEEEIRRYRKKGEQLFEESRENLQYQLRDFDLDDELMNQAMREFAQREEEYLDVLSKGRQNILRKQEDMDEKYYRDLKQLTNENK